MSEMIMENQVIETEEEVQERQKRLRRKNIAVGLTILAFIVLLYFVSYIRVSTL